MPSEASGPEVALTVVVDGSNVVHDSWWRASYEPAQRSRRLLDLLASTAAARSWNVELVFDGVEPLATVGERQVGRVRVVTTGPHAADDAIERIAFGLARSASRFWLVTADRQLATVAGASAERVLAARELLDDLDPREPQAPQHGGDMPAGSLASRLSQDVVDRLERLRRGESSS